MTRPAAFLFAALVALLAVAAMRTLSPAAFWVLAWAGVALTLLGLAVVERHERVLEQQRGQ